MTVALDWLPQAAYFYLLIFARLGAFLMLVPALGEDTIPRNLRLAFAADSAAVRAGIARLSSVWANERS
jgi:flagellar biosynthetic protein FliR